MLSARQYFSVFTSKLSAVYDEGEAKAITNYITSELLLIKLHQLAVIDKTLSDADISYFDEMLRRLLDSEPVQYVVGFTWFCGMKFEVNPHVLIPRPETEELVELVIQECRSSNLTTPSIIDLGTGSGCIPVALKKSIPGARVFATDIMEQALETAKHNARINKTDITFFKDDILNPEHIMKHGPFDIILSNPPYIAEEEATTMEQHVLNHEPRIALFSPGDPLKFYKAISNISRMALKPNGKIALEINPLLAGETAVIFEGAYPTTILTDMSGKKRFVKAG